MVTYYQILGIPFNSPIEEIKKAYRKIAIAHHPDKNSSPESLNIFKQASAAYKALITYSKIKNYGTGRTPKTKSRNTGSDLHTNLMTNLEELIQGKKHTLSILRKGLCQKCSGTGSETGKSDPCHLCHPIPFKNCFMCHGKGFIPEKVCKACGGLGIVEEKIQIKDITVPPNQEYMVFPEQGHYPVGGGSPGDLQINILVDRHKRYSINGLDIHYNLLVTPAKAIIGGPVDHKFFNKLLTIEVPSLSDNGSIVRIQKQGLTYKELKGDFIVTIRIQMPRMVSKDELELYRQISKIEKKG